MDIIAIDDLAIVTNTPIVPVIATSNDILTTIDRYYGNKEAQAVAEKFSRERENLYKEEEVVEDASVNNAPIVVLVKTIIEQAVVQRASDIHIEPLETKIRVRYRVDGTLIEAGMYPLNMLSALIARIKIIGGMDISEKRKPQDGRITQHVKGVEYDIRVSLLPTVFGEKVVMRLTAKTTLTRDKKLLGFSDTEMKKFDRLLSNPHGIILVTGPTGSGKSTTLYTALSELNKSDVNIITVEDPVEANVDGINQVQVNAKAELTFATALRSILRQDPDIIMIGEIRDTETASIAVTASITGHLVVSTLHTNSAASSITRLADMGVEPYLIADSVVGVIAQRLVRRLCTCKQVRKLLDIDYQFLDLEVTQETSVYEPKGCPICNETGYKGRIGVYEIMVVSNKLKSIISRGGSAEEIQNLALQEGMNTLKDSAKALVLQGITSIDEMRRIAYSNDEEVL
jgi:type IV pilus assembly protein PilB